MSTSNSASTVTAADPASTVSSSDAAASVSSSDAAASVTTAEPTIETTSNATSDSTADSSANSSADSTANASTNSAADSTTNGRGLLLGLVPDEVNFGLAGLSGSDSGDGDLRSFFGPLDQDVDKGLLRVLVELGNDWSSGSGRSGSLDEDDLVVLLGWGRGSNRPLGLRVLRLWGRNMDVDVLLNSGGLVAAGVSTARAEAGSTAAEPTAAGEAGATAAGESTTEGTAAGEATSESTSVASTTTAAAMTTSDKAT